MHIVYMYIYTPTVFDQHSISTVIHTNESFTNTVAVFYLTLLVLVYSYFLKDEAQTRLHHFFLHSEPWALLGSVGGSCRDTDTGRTWREATTFWF